MIKLIEWLLWPTIERPQDGEFDFTLDVVAIERVESGSTCVFYINKNGEGANYTFRCPLTTHARMLAQFRQKLELQQSAKAAK